MAPFIGVAFGTDKDNDQEESGSRGAPFAKLIGAGKSESRFHQSRTTNATKCDQLPFGGLGLAGQAGYEFDHFTTCHGMTNSAQGILRNADVCIHEGKVRAVGSNLDASVYFPENTSQRSRR